MRIMLHLALTLFVTAAAPPTPSATEKSEKTTMPTPKMAPVNDKDYAEKILAAHKGKVVVVNFWASYCLPCLQEIPDLQALAKEHEKAGVDVVFISSDPPSQAPHALAQLSRRKIEISSFIVDSEDPEPFIAMINASSKDGGWGGEMPYTVVYDRDGKVLQKMPGGHKKEDFNAAIVAALAASPAKGSTTTKPSKP